MSTRLLIASVVGFRFGQRGSAEVALLQAKTSSAICVPHNLTGYILWGLIVWEEVVLHVASTLTQTAPWIIYDISTRVEKVGCVRVKSGSVMLGAGRVSHGCGMGVGRVSDGCRTGVG